MPRGIPGSGAAATREIEPTNGGASAIATQLPYRVAVELTGTCDLLLHRYNVEAVAEKAAAAKNSEAKRTDDLESYVFRDDDGYICIPGEYLRQTICNAAKYKQDPRSPRKSAKELYTAGVYALTQLAPIVTPDEPDGATHWQYEHRCRVLVQRTAISRTRPAFKIGWKAKFVLMVGTPEYITPDRLHDTVVQGGRLVGLADFRPTYGRYNMTEWKILSDE